MAVGQLSKVIHHFRSVMLRQDAEGRTDADLLKLYVRQRDEVAFETLMRRHGPMVLGVCRRVVHNSHDAEDAFQATFLVLVRKAATVRSVGNWLYGVAYRTALEAKKAVAKRRQKEAKVVPRTEIPDMLADLLPVIDQELARLPNKYREVVVLCDLEGKSRKNAARHLGLAEGTVASRLARARVMLAKRLAPHGLTLSGGSLAMALSQNAASACVATSLVVDTMKAATLFSTGPAAATGVISAKVAALAQGVLKTMFLTKLKIATVVVLGMVLIGTGAGLQTAPPQGVRQAETKKPAPAVPMPQQRFQQKNAPRDAELLKRLEELRLQTDRIQDAELLKRLEELRLQTDGIQDPELLKRLEELRLRQEKSKDGAGKADELQKTLGELKKTYALTEAEDLKCVKPPFPVARQEWFRVANSRRNMLVVNGLPADSPPNGMFMTFRWNKGDLKHSGLHNGNLGPENPGVELVTWFETVAGVSKQDVEGNQEILKTRIGADFIVREGVPAEKIVSSLETILRKEFQTPVKLSLREVERIVYVANGKYRFVPVTGRPKDRVELYAKDIFDHKFGGDGSGDFPEFLQGVGRFIGKRVVAGKIEDAPKRIRWHESTPVGASQAEWDAAHDPESVLKRLKEQTGLTFNEEVRRVRVLFVLRNE